MPVDNRACDKLNGFMHAGFLHLGPRDDEQLKGEFDWCNREFRGKSRAQSTKSALTHDLEQAHHKPNQSQNGDCRHDFIECVVMIWVLLLLEGTRRLPKPFPYMQRYRISLLKNCIL